MFRIKVIKILGNSIQYLGIEVSGLGLFKSSGYRCPAAEGGVHWFGSAWGFVLLQQLQTSPIEQDKLELL